MTIIARRIGIFFYILLPGNTGLMAQPANPNDRPNILWLTSEDNSAYCLGCYGNQQAQIPNLDQLASEGVRYSNFFVNAPVCTVNRTLMILGVLAPALGLQHMRCMYAIPENYRTYTHYLQEADNYTFNRNKNDFNFPHQPSAVWDSNDVDSHYATDRQDRHFSVFSISGSPTKAAYFNDKV